MDHAQGRAFHHHLARAIMHLNHLAGLLPFFEPSIEWDDSMPSSHFRLERPTSRGLHTFVPLPPSSHPPTMVSHGGIPSQMIVNPEPNLRPSTTHRFPHGDDDHIPGSNNEARNPVPIAGHAMDPSPGTSIVAEPPWATTRTTVPVPVRSKQRASSTEDPQPKKKQKSMSAPESTATVKCGCPVPLPIISEIPHEGFNSDDSDDGAASGAASTHDHPDTNLNYSTTVPPNTTSTTPPDTSTPLTLTPNPNATIRILQPNPADPPRDPPYRPWTNTDDQELISLKRDGES